MTVKEHKDTKELLELAKLETNARLARRIQTIALAPQRTLTLARIWARRGKGFVLLLR